MPSSQVTLKEYFEAQIVSLREALEARFTVSETHSREDADRIVKRLDTSNGQMAGLSKRVEMLESLKTYQKGASWAFALMMTVLFSVASILIKIVWK